MLLKLPILEEESGKYIDGEYLLCSVENEHSSVNVSEKLNCYLDSSMTALWKFLPAP